MHLQGVAGEIMCRAFLTMLKGSVKVWFSRLMPNSISTFKELSAPRTLSGGTDIKVHYMPDEH